MTVDRCVAGVGCENTELKVATCLIEGECYPAGATRAGFVCQLCDPEAASRAWSNAKTTTQNCEVVTGPCADAYCENGLCKSTPNEDLCDDGLACTLADACSDGACTGQLRSDACLIDGACYAELAQRKLYPCHICLPTAERIGQSSHGR